MERCLTVYVGWRSRGNAKLQVVNRIHSSKAIPFSEHAFQNGWTMASCVAVYCMSCVVLSK